MKKDKIILNGLAHTEYEHDMDRKALDALKKTPGLSLVGRYITRNMIEKMVRIQYTGSNLKVTKKNYPKVYEKLKYACEILDLSNVPELYIEWGYDINACTIGSDNPIIILNSGLLDLCCDDEILFIIGHECGHIKSNHMLYHMMAQTINSSFRFIPFGDIAAEPIKYWLYYWDRMSEFTADRAGMLCCQNKTAVMQAFVKMAGLPINEFENCDIGSFILQAVEFQDLDEDTMSRLIKFVSISEENHPWTVMRAAEILKWIDAQNYQYILDNHSKA